MKNFTNNFKQFTSRLSARWLIMALMMLVGTSSAWASTVYFINSLSWTDIKIYYWGNVSVDWENSPSMTKESYQINGSDVYKYTFNTDPQNVIFRGSNGNDVQTVDIAFSAGEQWTPNDQWDNGKAKGSWSTYTPPCTKSVSNGTGSYSNGTITLSAKFNTCGNAFIGFQWKEEDNEWCYDNNADCYVMLGKQEKSNETVTTTLTKSGGTYVFRPYIVDGSDATKWIYGDEFEVITCSDPSAGYSISNENASVDWDGTEKEVTITTVNGYATPSKIYYEGSETKPTAVGEYTITIDVPSKGTYCAATDLEIGTFTITCPTIAAPAITTSATVCEGTKVTLSSYNGDNTNTVKWYSSQEFNSEVTEQVTLTDDGTKYYAKAYDEASGCYSSEYSTLTFTVNPLPTINISGSEEAVLYEDVELTAATDGTSISWEITEGDGSLSSTTGNSVTLTSSSADNVTVTATATLGICTATDTHEVAFSAENCADVASNDIQITFVHPAPASNKTGQWWGMGTLYYSTNNSTWKSIDMGSSTSGSVTKTITNVTTNELYVYFESYWTYSHNTKAKTNTLTLDSGNKYDIKITRHGDDNTSATATATKTGSLSAPAVKMISAEYDEVNDKIVAKGAVYKTGCGVTFWGFQYSTDGQTWGGKDEDYIRPNSGNSLTKANEFHYSFPISNANGGETYYIRAYALNNYNGSYALSNAVYSATSLPVEIPSKTIEFATISLVDSEGDALDVTEVCPQSTVYLKVSYVGGDFKEYEAADNFPGTNLELVNHDKVNDYAIFSYTATATGVANITISNDNTSITTTDGVSITLKNVTPVNAPMISISQGTICEKGSATITVNNPIPGLTYTLYKETTKIPDPVIYNDDDLTFNVTEAGSYTVRAEESVCKNYANSMAVELKVVTSDVKIGLAVDKTTVNPWQPLKLTVTAPEGYAYTIDALNDVVYTQAGNVYTIKIPRPNNWSPGDSGDPVQTKNITFEAKIQVSDDLTCGSSSITVKLEDTEENCK